MHDARFWDLLQPSIGASTTLTVGIGHLVITSSPLTENRKTIKSKVFTVWCFLVYVSNSETNRYTKIIY